MTFKESLSVEESNNERLKLGLKPLAPETNAPEAPVSVLDEEQQAFLNFKQLRQEHDREREWRNNKRNFQEAARRMQELETFKFNVNVERGSEYGHEMSEREAYKELSQRFHGKKSGTMKKGRGWRRLWR